MTAEGHGYPEDLAGEPAPPPGPVAPRTFDMAVRAYERALVNDPDAGELRGAGPWRVAEAVLGLFREADAVAPDRNKASDGRIGDARHAKLGRASDHNPWLVHHKKGIVRAGDLTNDPALQLHAVFERIRAAAAGGWLPHVLNGGYLIINGRITAPDFREWREYKGSNPHVAAGHVSVSLNPAQFDSKAPWGVFDTPAPPPAPAAPPAAAQGPGWTGPDLTGTGTSLRGDEGNNGPRVAAWQQYLRDMFPAYRHAHGHLDVDGWWGPVTTAWNREFAHRSGITSADGRNIGPRLAAAYSRAGLFRTMSAARRRAVGHVARPARR